MSAHDLFGPVPGGAFYLDDFYSGKDPALMLIRVGVTVEKETNPGGLTALFGGGAMLHMFSTSDVFVDTAGDIEPDGWMNFEFTVYIGGSAPLTDGVDIVGAWGPTISMLGKIEADGEEIVSSATNFGSSAHLLLRWWLWGE